MTPHFQGLYSEFGMVKLGKGRFCPQCFWIVGLSVTGNRGFFCKPLCGGDGRPELSRISAETRRIESKNAIIITGKRHIKLGILHRFINSFHFLKILEIHSSQENCTVSLLWLLM